MSYLHPSGTIIDLGVNIDHVATLRNARGTMYPDPIRAALLAEQAGADRVRIGGAARVAQGGDVVDVDAQVDDRAGRVQEAHSYNCIKSINIWRVFSGAPPRWCASKKRISCLLCACVAAS